MQTKRFVASDMSRALALVREELGDDAMILSTQRTSKGVEIVATLEDIPPPIMDKGDGQPAVNTRQASHLAQEPSRGLASGKTQEELALELEMARRRMMAVKKEENVTLGEWVNRQPDTVTSSTRQPRQTTPQAQPTSPTKERYEPNSNAVAQQQDFVKQQEKDNEEIRRLQDEIANMRDTFETQLAFMAEEQERRYQDQQVFGDVVPVIANVKQRLEQLGLTRACNDQIVRSLKSLDDQSMTEENLWAESLVRLSRQIPAITSDPVATGGIYAFLGTTGVGKTTTIAKLAARHVMDYGPQDVALLTTDTFRIAAHDQLRSLGRILNVQVKVVDDLKQLPQILARFSKQALVLIDTPGMSYNDPLLKQHLTALRRCRHVQNTLVLSANSQYQMMQASMHSYRIANPRFCVMTKLDECASLGDAMSVLANNKLPLAYVTHGQAIPDDLAIIKPHQLVSKAVKLSKLAISSKQQPKQGMRETV